MSGVLLFAAIFLQCKKMGILSALRVAVANAPALRRTDVRLVDPRFANKFACQEFCFLLLFFCNAKKWGFSLRCGLPSLTLRLCGGLTSAWSIPVLQINLHVRSFAFCCYFFAMQKNGDSLCVAGCRR